MQALLISSTSTSSPDAKAGIEVGMRLQKNSTCFAIIFWNFNLEFGFVFLILQIMFGKKDWTLKI